MSKNLASALSELEADRSPTAIHRLVTPIRKIRKELEEVGEGSGHQVIAEEIAFTLNESRGESSTEWGIHFGPVMSWVTSSGERESSPALEMVTPKVISYWRERAKACDHPLMRARYADLVWELPKAVSHSSSDHRMARLAVRSYEEAAKAGLFEHSVRAVAALQRALDLALSLRDKDLVEPVVDALWELEGNVAEDDSLGLWGFSFDRLLLESSTLMSVPASLEKDLVDDLEARLERLSKRRTYLAHPFEMEAAATRLAQYYRGKGRADDVQRVMTVYASAVQAMDPTSSAMIRLASLEKLYDQLRAFDLHETAHELSGAIQTAANETLSEMKSIEVSHEIPREEVDRFFESLLQGEGLELIRVIAGHFIPSREKVEDQLTSMADETPLVFLMHTQLKDHKGRTVATIGPLDSDLEGHVAKQMAQNLQLGAHWLRETFRRSIERQLVSKEDLVEALTDAPVFEANQEVMLQAGIEAYWNDDSVCAIHVLIPQIEQAVRNLAGLLEMPVFSRKRRGGLQYRTLDDLLSDQAMVQALGGDLSGYLRILLTDPRGWNLRNKVCHGLAPASSLGMPVADRALHALLSLTLVRRTSPLDVVEQFNTDLRLSWRQIADMIGCTASTLRRWRRIGAVPERSPYQKPVEKLAALHTLLSMRFPSDEKGLSQARQWLRNDSAELGGIAPARAWRHERRDDVLRAAYLLAEEHVG